METIKVGDSKKVLRFSNLEYDKSKLLDELIFNLDISKQPTPQTALVPGIQSDVFIIGGELSNLRDKVISILDEQIYKSKNTYAYKNWIYQSKNSNQFTSFHDHTNMIELKTKGEWTWTFYAQMPDNLKGDDGEILFMDGDITVGILPQEGDLFIFPADLLHMPNTNQSSTKDRMVLAGTVCKMDLNKKYVKKKKTLL